MHVTQKEIAVLLALLAFFGLFTFLQPSITGYAVVDPTMDITLSKTKYLANETLDGEIKITFPPGQIRSDTQLRLELGSLRLDQNLTQILAQTNHTIKAAQEVLRPVSGAKSRLLSFQPNVSKVIAFKLPHSATVTVFNANLNLAGTPPSFLYVDVGADGVTGCQPDGKREWQYFGSFLSFDAPVYPSSLTPSQEADPIFLNSNLTMHCEAIDLPYSRDYQIGAKYLQKVPGAGIFATLFSISGTTTVLAEGGFDKCELPAEQSSSAWAMCKISFPVGRQGRHLVCITVNDTQADYFELARDNSVSTARYTCDVPGASGSGTCTFQSSKDYFIGAAGGLYSKTLTSPLLFDEWRTDIPFNSSLTSCLAQCIPDDVGDCAIPVTLLSETAGEVSFDALRIDYLEPGGAAASTTDIYDIQVQRPDLIEIDGQNLSATGFNLTLPLSLFPELKMTAKDNRTVEELRVSITGGPTLVRSLQAFTSATSTSVTDTQQLIASTKQNVQTLKTQHAPFLNLLRSPMDLSPLDALDAQLRGLSQGNLSLEEQENQSRDLRTQILEARKPLPETITLAGTFRDLSLVGLEDITQEVTLEDKTEIFLLQTKVKVNLQADAFLLRSYGGNETSYTMVTKTVTATEPLTDIFLVESIPKEAAASAHEVILENLNAEILQEDPIFRLHLDSLSPGQPYTLRYLLTGGLTSALTQRAKTILIGGLGPAGPSVPQPTCGDSICTRPLEDETICPADCEKPSLALRITLIILLLLVLLLGSWYIYFYRGHWSMKELLRTRMPFKTLEDLEQVKTYITDSRTRSMTEAEIGRSLLSKGWTPKQIRFATDELEWDKQRTLALRLAPGSKEDMKKLVAYIRTCREAKVPDDRIRQALLKKGWVKEQIAQGLGQASGGSFFGWLGGLFGGAKTEKSAPKKETKKEEPFDPFAEQKGL